MGTTVYVNSSEDVLLGTLAVAVVAALLDDPISSSGISVSSGAGYGVEYTGSIVLFDTGRSIGAEGVKTVDEIGWATEVVLKKLPPPLPCLLCKWP